MLIDTPGQPLRTRPRGGLGLRPVDEGSGERQVQATVYGDAGSDGPAHSLGRPVRQYDTAGEVRMSYDFRGRVVEQVRRVFEDIDALDRVVEQTAPNGSETAYSYDPGGKLLGIELDAAAVVEEILYNARGQRLSITYGNGTETTYEYDEDRFWLTRLLTMRSTEPLQDLTYTHDAVGNILAVEDDAQQTFYFSNTQVTPEQTFGYDSRYRLVEATGREKIDMAQTTHAPPAPGAIPDAGNPALRTYVQSTTYDAAGNITQMHHVPSSGSNWTRNYSIHADNNQLLATSIPGNSSAYDDEYAYNERGAMVFMPHLRAGVSENVVRDFRDQVRKVLLLNSGDEAWYATDAAGQRVRKLVRHGQNAHERIYVGGYEIYRPMDTIAEELVVEIHTVHVMDGEQRVLMAETRTVIDDEPVTSPVAVLRYQYSNHLGTATLECDEEGEIISYEEYHPYGTTAWWAEKSGIQVSRKRYRYTGMERDEETGMAYHHHRYYLPWLGRWASADPAGLVDGGNRFAYGRGAPTRGNDPTGTEYVSSNDVELEEIADVMAVSGPVGQEGLRQLENARSADQLLAELRAKGLSSETTVDGRELDDAELVAQIASLQLPGANGEPAMLTAHEAMLALFIDPRFSDSGSPDDRIETLYRVLADSPDQTELPSIVGSGSRFKFGATGFARPFDDRFVNLPDSLGSNQVQHALQAIVLGHYGLKGSETLAIALVVGHEMSGDRAGTYGPFDVTGQKQVAQGLGFGATGKHLRAFEIMDLQSIPISGRQGSSLEDLLLTKVAFDIGRESGLLSRDSVAALIWRLGAK